MVTADEFQDAIEIEKGHVYFLCLRSEPPSTGSVHFFTFLQHYEPFFADFGPLNMASVYRFCRVLRAKKEEFPDRKVVYWCSHTAPQRANAVYLMGAYQVLVLGRSGEDAFAPFAGLYPPLLPFRDAQCGPSSFNLTVLDCLKGLRRAKLLGWADLETFDVDEYEFYERPEHGDFNWLVPGRFMAFSSPHDPPIRDPQTGAPLTMTPQEYFPLFRPRNVTTVVRLNGKATYDGRKFSDFGFAHHHLYFDDGSNPPDAILKEFLELSEAAPAAVAVHCKAGLGRTGTLIACYIMKHFRFSATEAIGYLRIQRPGSVLGGQQHFLKEMEARLWRMGDAYRKAHRFSIAELVRLGAVSLAGWAKGAPLDPALHALTVDTRPNVRPQGTRAPPVGPVQSALLTRSRVLEKSLNTALSEAPNNIQTLSRLLPALQDPAAAGPGASVGFHRLAPRARGGPRRTPTPVGDLLKQEALGTFRDGTLVDHMLAKVPAEKATRPGWSLLFSTPMEGPPKPTAPATANGKPSFQRSRAAPDVRFMPELNSTV